MRNPAHHPARRASGNRTTALLVAVVAALAVAPGCSGAEISTGPKGSTGSTPGSPAPGPGLGGQGELTNDAVDGRSFVGTWPGANGGTGTTVPPGATGPSPDRNRVVVTFEDRRISANAGCNGMGATYSIQGGQLVLSDDLGSTAMACEPALMERDAEMGELLHSRPELSLDGAVLTIAGNGITLVLTDDEVADPDRPLEGTTWTVDGFTSGSGDSATVGSSSMLSTTKPTLTLSSGQASAFGGCNRGGGEYTTDGDPTAGTITFAGIMQTEIGCAPDILREEEQVMSVLSGPVTYEIDGPRLTLHNPTLARGLTLHAS